MQRMTINTPSKAQAVVEGLYKDLERRIIASPPGLCPVDMAASFLKLCHAQTCGKCVPCRVGLSQLSTLLDDVLEHRGTEKTIALIEKTAKVIQLSADCAIGYEAATMVLRGIDGFREDYLAHVNDHRCLYSLNQPVPCVSLCPAGVDVPGYIALAHEGRNEDAVRLIRKDNPFPTVCAFICEHPCEARCRRNMIDQSINIRGIKRYVVEQAGTVPVPPRAPSTGKRVAVIGGGPGGLSAAYYLALMGHDVVIYEKRAKLGGMLRYGIPNYRLPAQRLDAEIADILSVGGIEVRLHAAVGQDVVYQDMRKDFDSVYIAIGAHIDKKIGIPGEDGQGVISAVDLLRGIGDGILPSFAGKHVVVIGGGNVAMDCTRSARRLGAKTVKCVYRRGQREMTALNEEIEGAIAEGCELCTMMAPASIQCDENNQVTALWVRPQMTGKIDKYGRPTPVDAQVPQVAIAADIVIVAIGQGIESNHFSDSGVSVKHGAIEALDSSAVRGDQEGVFAGGDCVTGPATVIRAIAAGKVAAGNIDNYLGYHHEITIDFDIPSARLADRPACGRVNLPERPAGERKEDFDMMEQSMSQEEAMQECSRCLRCDHFGYGVFKGGRVTKW